MSRCSESFVVRTRRAGGLALACLIVTVAMTLPLFNYAAIASATYQGDVRLIVWTLAWDNHAVLSGLPLFDSNTFFPAADSLSYNEHLFGLSLFTLPLYAATTNPVLAYNVVWWCSFPLNLLAAHALLKRYVGHDLPAFAGALVYTFSFYKMLHAHGHLHLVWTWLLPLSLLCIERWFERPTLVRAALWASAVILQSLTSWYLAVMTGIAHGVLLAWLIPAWWRRGHARALWQLALAVLVIGAAVWPFARHYLGLPPSSVTEVAGNSADLAGYLVPPQNTWLGHAWTSAFGPGPRWIWGERTLFLGWLTLVLAALGVAHLAARRRWSPLGAWLSLTIVALVLSFGPSREGAWTLFSLLSHLPGLGAFRAPARFALLVLLGLAVLVAFGTRELQERLGRAAPVLGVVLALMLVEWYVTDFPGGRPRPFAIPPIYRSSQVRTARALVSLPDYRGTREWYKGADYLYFSTAHWRPIVNGFGRTEPPDHRHVISHMMAFPGPNNARTMRQLGVEYVVLHAERIPEGDDLALFAARMGEYDLVVHMDHDYLFRVRPGPQ